MCPTAVDLSSGLFEAIRSVDFYSIFTCELFWQGLCAERILCKDGHRKDMQAQIAVASE